MTDILEKVKLYARLVVVVLFIGMAITIGGQHLQARALRAEKAQLEQAAAMAIAEA